MNTAEESDMSELYAGHVRGVSRVVSTAREPENSRSKMSSEDRGFSAARYV